jgi:hypothetical protein
MSQGTVTVQSKQEKDFTVGTPEEFVRRFGGTKVINKVKSSVHILQNLGNLLKNLNSVCM